MWRRHVHKRQPPRAQALPTTAPSRCRNASAQSAMIAGSFSGNTGRSHPASAASAATATMSARPGQIGGRPRVGRWTSILGCGLALNPSTSTRSTGASRVSRSDSLRLVAAHFVHQRPAGAAANQHLGGAGLAMAPGILAGLVQVEAVMGMLDGRDRHAAGHEQPHQRNQQSGLAAARPARQAKHLQGPARRGAARDHSRTARRGGAAACCSPAVR